MPNNMQNMEVQGVPGSPQGDGTPPDRERILNGRTILFHYAHVKGGRRRSQGCPFCTRGLDGATTIRQSDEPGNGVVQSDRTDEEGNASYSYDRDWPWS